MVLCIIIQKIIQFMKKDDQVMKKEIKAKQFKDNWPGKDGLADFIKRQNLTKQVSDNEKPAWAEITRKVIIDFFNNLE